MSTEKQILANRQNALKAGVKTEAGKAISKMNAVSHGLLTKEVLLPGEDAACLEKLRQQMVDELKPVGELEIILVERIVTSVWRLKRALRSERKYSRPPSPAVSGPDLVVGGDYRWSSWQNYSRYETSLERQVYTAMKTLERLRSLRRG